MESWRVEAKSHSKLVEMYKLMEKECKSRCVEVKCKKNAHIHITLSLYNHFTVYLHNYIHFILLNIPISYPALAYIYYTLIQVAIIFVMVLFLLP